MNGADEFVFVALGGLGEIGMNCRALRLRPAAPAQMDHGRLRPHLRRT